MAPFLTNPCSHCEKPVLVFRDFCYACGHMAHIAKSECRCPPCAESAKTDRIYDAMRDAQILNDGGDVMK